ncbi:MAG: hypothetical protein RSC80_05655 [Odoribacter sp.]
MKGILFVLLVFSNSFVFAQGKLSDEKRKEFDAQKVAFFTQELDLSPSEAAKFWPLYNEMQKKTRSIEMEIRKSMHTVKELKESQYEDAVNQLLNYENEIQIIKKEYYQKMLRELPASKIWKLNEAERKFHRQLFDRLRRESESHKN